MKAKKTRNCLAPLLSTRINGSLLSNRFSQIKFGQEIRKRFGRRLKETRGNGMTLEIKFAKPTSIDPVMLVENFREGERV